MENRISFKTTDLAKKIECAKNETIHLYKTNGYDAEADALIDELNNIAEDEKIRVVFIGQYTAGKSTIISALTSDNSIIIDSNISTDKTSDYEYGDVILTDTPGLYTENPEHDERTIDMIKKSDLLIYCITSDLFNQYTLSDFVRWAFTVGYAGKMFLIINKMSKEYGSYDELKENYSKTINQSLQPHTLSEFPCSFVDAKDYRDGVKEEDSALIEFSHFQSFIAGLNSFIKQKGYLGKMDTPIMIIKASIDNITQSVIDDESHRAYEALVSRIEKKIDQKRNQFSIDARAIIRRGLKPILEKGNDLSRKVGVEDIEESDDEINDFLAEVCTKTNTEIEHLCEKNVEELMNEIEEVLSSDLTSYFFNSVSANYNEKKHLFENKENKISREKFDTIKGVVESITGKTIGMATKGGAASGKFLIKATEASGSQLHNAVLAVGKTFGVKFKPWQAVNIAKNIGNIAKFLGPVVSVVGLLFDIKETYDEEKKANDIQSAQIEVRKQFADIYSDLENQYSDALKGMYDVYDEISGQLQSNKKRVQTLISNNNTMLTKLSDIRDELVEIQKEIF